MGHMRSAMTDCSAAIAVDLDFEPKAEDAYCRQQEVTACRPGPTSPARLLHFGDRSSAWPASSAAPPETTRSRPPWRRNAVAALRAGRPREAEVPWTRPL